MKIVVQRHMAANSVLPRDVPRRAPSVEEVLLRRKATAALSVLRESAAPTPLAPPPTHLFVTLSRSRTAPTHLRTNLPQSPCTSARWLSHFHTGPMKLLFLAKKSPIRGKMSPRMTPAFGFGSTENSSGSS